MSATTRTRSHSLFSHRHVDASQLRLTEEFCRAVSEEVVEDEAVDLDELEDLEEEDEAMLLDLEATKEEEEERRREMKERARTVARLEGSPSPSPSASKNCSSLRSCQSESDVRRSYATPPRSPLGRIGPGGWIERGADEGREEEKERGTTLAQRRGMRVVSIVKAERKKLELGRPTLVLRSPLSPSSSRLRSSAPPVARKVRSSSRLALVNEKSGLCVGQPAVHAHARRVSLADVSAAYADTGDGKEGRQASLAVQTRSENDDEEEEEEAKRAWSE
ncbi:hypothetical protein JCM8547_002470 [Rhodosporidiobolus lusitaniae]